MVGIYKISSPSNKVYIGQSWEIEKRWYHYKYLLPYQRQFKLLNSFKKYGLDGHLFEIVHELPPDVTQMILDEYEKFYINQYKECGIELMNCTDGGKGGKLCEETKKRISERQMGSKRSIETRKKMSEANRRRALSPNWKGRKVKVKKGYGAKSEDHKRNLSISFSSGQRKGEKNNKAKLTEAQVIKIRDRYNKGERQVDLGKEFNVGRNTIFDIVHNNKWKHLN